MHLVIDNYDSFTYNIVQCLGMLGAAVAVRRSDQITIADIETLQPQSLIVSPGPCTPNEAGISTAAIRHFAGRLPILGVCLGHQCIAAAFGGMIRRADAVYHGKVSKLRHDGRGLFAGVPPWIPVGRYHSLVVDALPECLAVTARELRADGSDGEVMALEHRELPVWGVQFHPESVLTEHGMLILQNYLVLTGAHASVEMRAHSLATTL